jgi:hypothetical protein
MPLLETRASGSALAYGLNSFMPSSIVTSGLLLNLDAGNGASYGGQNHVLYSEDFTTGWDSATYGIVVSSNSTVAPDGTTTADLCTGGASNPTLIFQNISNVSGLYGTGAKRVSIYAKAATATVFTLNCYWSGETEINIDFNLATGTVVSDSSGGTASPSIESVGNGWYLCSYTVPARVGSATGTSFRIWPSGRGLTGTGIYLWGAQQRDTTSTPGYIRTTGSGANYNSTTWYDTSGNNFNGTLVGSPAYTVSPGYFTFNTAKANTKYVTFPDNNAVDFLNKSPYTLETWAFITESAGVGGYPGFINHENTFNAGRDGYNLYYTDVVAGVSSALSHERFVQGSADRGEYTDLNTNLINKWKHITATFDGSAIAFYVDGVQRSKVTISLGNITNNSVLLTGADRGGQRLDGRQAVMRIYDKALTPFEVAQNYNAVKSRYGL